MFCLIFGVSACTQPVSASMPSLAVLYAMPRGMKEIGWLARYSARGSNLQSPRRLGLLGLVAEFQTVSASRATLAVATGNALWLSPGSTGYWHRILPPASQAMLSVRWMAGRWYAVTENPTTRQVAVERLSDRHWHRVRTLPGGLARLWPVSPFGPVVSVMGPHFVRWYALDDRRIQSPRLTKMRPQGSVGFTASAALIPYALGVRRFGLARLSPHKISRQTFSSIRRAPLEVTDTRPLWAAAVSGMVPYDSRTGGFDWRRMVQWPGSMATTVRLVGSGPWILAMDGSAQGYWFNVNTGRFGPRFVIVPPPGGIVRAVAIVPSSTGLK